MSEIREQVYVEAFEALRKKDYKGTLEIATGVGKTLISLRSAINLYKDKNWKGIKKLIFAAEQVDREKDLLDDIQKLKDLFKIDIKEYYSIEFICYQSLYKKQDEADLLIADEIHCSLSKEYSKLYFRNKFKHIIGLSATISDVDDTEILYDVYTKKSILNLFAPIIYSYTLTESVEKGTTRPLKIFTILHSLDNTHKVIESGNAKNRFLTTEKKQYDYLDSQFNKAIYTGKDFLIKAFSAKRGNLLYALPSKVNVVKQLLQEIEGQSLIFANNIDFLYKCTNNVITSTTKVTSSKKEQDLLNVELRAKFDNKEIKELGAFKKLEQGANLKDLDNVILASYYSVELKAIQRIGRLRMKDSTGVVFIIVTIGTKEVDWHKKMMSNLDFDNTPCYGVEDAIKKYKEWLKTQQ